ncbi:hypothetical protein ACFPM0_21905 [Pseudonocardia sulfidoxydans]|uniref:hypothetical protein n=1 Tax=Pseudonocardia sulfidoxydans TaxID=54011 RepID=UPI0036066A2E
MWARRRAAQVGHDLGEQGAVVAVLPAGHHQCPRTPASINHGVDLRRQPTEAMTCRFTRPAEWG